MSDSSRKMGHVQDFRVYLRTLLLLFTLTALTIFAAQFNFGVMNNLIAVLIAMIKASLVILFFMHGKYEGKLTWAFIYYPLLLLIVLLGALFLDYGNREKKDFAVQAKIAAVHGEHGGSEDHSSMPEGASHAVVANPHEESTSASPAQETTETEAHPVEAASESAEAPVTTAPSTAAEISTDASTASGWDDLPGDAAKGREKARIICIACHVVEELGQPFPGAPPFADSANKPEITPAYLRKWLKDPPKVKPGTLMPNFGLSDDDIENLIAFLKTYKH